MFPLNTNADPGVARIAIWLATPRPLLSDLNLTETRVPLTRSDGPRFAQRTRPDPRERRVSLPAPVIRWGLETGIAHRQFAGAGVVAQHLTLDLAFGRLRQHMDAEGEDVCSIQHCLDRGMIIGAQVAQRSLHSVTIDLGALVIEYFHGPPAEDLQRKLVTHRIHIVNRAADDCALSWEGWQGRP